MIATLVKIVIAWVVIVGVAGTLEQANHPVAMEAGRLLHTVSMVDPAIHWADYHDLRPVATGLRAVSQGLPLHAMFAASH